jgi:hypothetical protein
MAEARARKTLQWLLWSGALALILAGCAGQPAVETATPIPPGQARIWFYRIWLPSESLNLANIEINGAYAGSVANGGVFYRDVPPGTYHIVPESWAHDPTTTPRQDTNVAVGPGEQAYVKILDLTSWASSVSAAKNFERDSFYAWLIPPQIAQAEIGRDHTGL